MKIIVKLKFSEKDLVEYFGKEKLNAMSKEDKVKSFYEFLTLASNVNLRNFINLDCIEIVDETIDNKNQFCLYCGDRIRLKQKYCKNCGNKI